MALEALEECICKPFNLKLLGQERAAVHKLAIQMAEDEVEDYSTDDDDEV